MTSAALAGSLSAATVLLLIFMASCPSWGSIGEANRRTFVAPRGYYKAEIIWKVAEIKPAGASRHHVSRSVRFRGRSGQCAFIRPSEAGRPGLDSEQFRSAPRTVAPVACKLQMRQSACDSGRLLVL